MIIYVCTPNEQTKNPAQTKFACYLISKRGHVPIAPRLYFPQFIHHGEESLISQLLNICDQMWVIGPATDSMKEEMEMALQEHIPIEHFINMGVMADQLENGEVPEDESAEKPPRSFGELMAEMTRVTGVDEDTLAIIDEANEKARAVEKRSHIQRTTLEKIIYLYGSMRSDMDKVEMTEEEREIVLDKGIVSIADYLHLDSRIVEAVIDMAEEPINQVIAEYCEAKASEIANKVGLPTSLVKKVLVTSNQWRWRDRDQIQKGAFKTWWPKHVKELASLLGQSEGLIRKILDAEMEDE